MSSSSSSPSNHGHYQQHKSHGQGQGQDKGQGQGYDHDHDLIGSGSGGQQQQQNPTFPSPALSASRLSFPPPHNNNNNDNINIANVSTPRNSSSFSPSSSSAPPNRHSSHSKTNSHPNPHSSANTHLTSNNNILGTDNNSAPNQTSVDFPHHSKQGQSKFVSGPGGPFSSSSSSFSQLPPLLQQQHQQNHYSTEPQQQQQQVRSEDYYSLPSSMTPQSKGGQYPSPSHQQSLYQPQQQQQQQQQQQYQQRYSYNMNHSYQQSPQQQQEQQQQQSYSNGYSFQPQHQQHQQQQQQHSFSRTLPSPSVSLSSDEYLVLRGYASGGSSTGHNRLGEIEQPSVEDTSPSPKSNSDSNLRFKATLDAQTAAMQHQGDTPSTYLNKGQYYAISIQDNEEYDGDIHSVVRIAFHEDAHRKMASRYWSFWLSQQSNPKTARALDIERVSSAVMLEVQSKTFDRTQFKWNGKEGAKLMIRFNCLSTDFSRIKGVKGIPLRIQIETYDINYGGGDHGGRGPGARGGVGGLGGMDDGLLSHGRILEWSFAKIKLFRDKGAERKNKDDQKHLEKMWDKMRGKHADTSPLSQVLAPVQPMTHFWECLEDEEEYYSNEGAGSGSGSGSGSRGGSSDQEDGGGAGGGGGVGDDDEEMSSSSLDFFNQQQGGSGGGPVYYDSQQQQQDENSGGDGKSKRRKMNDVRLDPGASTGYRGSGSAGSGGGGGMNVSGAVSMIISSSSNSSVGGLAASIRHLPTTSNNNNNANNMIDGGIPPSSSSDTLDRDPSYIPQQRKKKPMTMLCLYIKIGNEAVYRAIYLERPTLNELLHKLCEKLEIQVSTVSAVYRKTTKKNLLVHADDVMVAQMPEELDMEVEYEFNQQDGSVNLTLKY